MHADGRNLNEVGGLLTRRDIIDTTLRPGATANVRPLAEERHGYDRVAADAGKGVKVCQQQCVACHGAKAEGGTGPRWPTRQCSR